MRFTMTRLLRAARRASIATPVILLLSACSADLSGPPGSLPRAPNWPANPALIVIDSPLVISRDQLLYRAVIPFRYVNPNSFTVARPGCTAADAPALQWWNGQQWMYAYSYAVPPCGGMSRITAPGGTVSDTLYAAVPVDSIGPDGHGVIPYWTGPRSEADYRLVWPLCRYDEEATGSPFCAAALPLEQVVSAPFRMTIDAR